VGGGYGNTANGADSCIPSGVSAIASHTDAFAWNGEYEEQTTSFGGYTFTVRCEGGAKFYFATGTNVGVKLAAG